MDVVADVNESIRMINSSIVALPHTDHAKTTLFGNRM